jgi:hypothetical protein
VTGEGVAVDVGLSAVGDVSGCVGEDASLGDGLSEQPANINAVTATKSNRRIRLS